MPNNIKPKILVCGVLPPPYFGHSVMYKMLMGSSFTARMDVRFINMHYWSYQTNKKVTGAKIFKMVRYYFQYIAIIIFWRPQYVLYNTSFYRMPFLKDFLFCFTGIISGLRVVFHDFGQYVRELHDALPFWQRGMLKWLLRHAAGSIVMGERVRLVYKGLMDEKNIFVVPGVVEDSYGIAAQPNRPVGKFFNMLYFSYMSRAKGIFIAFDAVEQIFKICDDVAITFGGPIESNEVAIRLEEIQKQYPDRVRYVGYVEDVRKRTALFRGADVFIFTTLRDVFGLVLLHAMAEGLPIVASREGAIPEIIPDGKHGILFDKGDIQTLVAQVVALVHDKDRCQSMGAANRKRFEEVYSLQRYGDYMVAALDAIDARWIKS